MLTQHMWFFALQCLPWDIDSAEAGKPSQIQFVKSSLRYWLHHLDELDEAIRPVAAEYPEAVDSTSNHMDDVT